MFDENGYEATTVEQIAAAANVSRATFFNYFPSKEAVVFSPDPDERADWQARMASRPATEPLWDSLTAILIECTSLLRERMLLHRRLMGASSTLTHSSQNLSEQFRSDLRKWVLTRPGGDSLDAILLLNLALTASQTAYPTWPTNTSFDDYLTRVEHCLRSATPAVAQARSSGDSP